VLLRNDNHAMRASLLLSGGFPHKPRDPDFSKSGTVI
jgi:hypothetical protein